MPDNPLLQLGEQYAELLVALDRGEVLRRALTLVTGDAEVAWAARPGEAGELSIEKVAGQRTARPCWAANEATADG